MAPRLIKVAHSSHVIIALVIITSFLRFPSHVVGAADADGAAHCV